MFVFPFNAFSPANAESCCYSSSRLSLAAVRLTIVMRNIKAHRRGKRQSKAGSTRNVSSQHHCQPNRKFSPFSYLHNTYKKNLILGPRSLAPIDQPRTEEKRGEGPHEWRRFIPWPWPSPSGDRAGVGILLAEDGGEPVGVGGDAVDALAHRRRVVAPVLPGEVLVPPRELLDL